MKDDGRTLPEIEEMTDEDFTIAAIRIEGFLKAVPQVTAEDYMAVREVVASDFK